MISERKGVAVEWNQQWKDYLQPEARKHSGFMGHKTMTYGARSILHKRDLDDSQMKVFSQRQSFEQMKNMQEALTLLKERLSKKKKNTKKNRKGSVKNLN